MRRIRAHHLFCMSLFSGHGYSGEFVREMNRTIASLKAMEPCVLAEGNDCICMACPNLKDGGGCCLGTEDVSKRDAAALQVLGLRTGDIITWEGIRKKISGISEDDFLSVCGGCRWSKEGLCSFLLLMESL